MKKYAIIVAGGAGIRMGSGIPKQFMILDGRPLLMYSIAAFADAGIDNIIVVIPKSFKEYWKELCENYSCHIPHQVVEGGLFRSESVKNGLSAVPSQDALVAVHDGVRPFIDKDFINQLYDLASETGSAVPYLDIRDSIRFLDKKENRSVERDKFKTVQTPQCFRLSVLAQAYNNNILPSFTDDAALVDQLNIPVTLMKGIEENIKITTPLDLAIAEAIIRAKKKELNKELK